jgi:hypothetical protein
MLLATDFLLITAGPSWNGPIWNCSPWRCIFGPGGVRDKVPKGEYSPHPCLDRRRGATCPLLVRRSEGTVGCPP